MKKIITLCVITLLAITSCAAVPKTKSLDIDNLLSSYSEKEGAEYYKVGNLLVGLISLFGDIGSELDGIKGVAVLDLSDCSNNIIEQFKKDTKRVKNLEMLIEMAEDDDSFKIYVEKKKERISELIMIDESDLTVIRIKCNITPKDLEKLVNQIDC